jgi:mycofactocin precursor
VSKTPVLEPIELEPEAAPAPPPPKLEPATTQPLPADEVLDDDLLVEEISIDGMCGVY